jgi:translation initiation factor IF-2
MAEKVLVVAESITVGELAEALNLPVTTLVGELFKNGIVATINQRIDFETATIIVEELGLDVELERKAASTIALRRLGSMVRRLLMSSLSSWLPMMA